MKFERLTNKKIRIIFNLNDMILNNMCAKDFLTDKSLSQKVLHSILSEAEKEIGFTTDDCKLLVEAITSSDGGLIFTITKVLNDYDINSNLATFRNLIFKFDCIDSFLALCSYLKHMNNTVLKNLSKNSSLILYNNTYYLLILNTNTSLIDLHLIASEFATIIPYTSTFEGILNEYGKIVINKNFTTNCLNKIY